LPAQFGVGQNKRLGPQFINRPIVARVGQRGAERARCDTAVGQIFAVVLMDEYHFQGIGQNRRPCAVGPEDDHRRA